ncbi:MAG TPA: S-adenosylmethionine:tRNA ribosyltransferase-isomerase [Streptosporangiaceae bacterium]|nr:S-adenosylmethionine:tRNA ribosyltransferase-isomerase [Streptosporangiaceae bacterium]
MRQAASRPAEERGLSRDAVRMLIATPDGLAHASFRDLPRYLAPGDLLVVNTSATLAAAVDGHRADGRPVTVHFSTPLDDGIWLVELRTRPPEPVRVRDGEPGERVLLPAGVSVTLLGRYPDPQADRLWRAATATGARDPAAYLAAHGRPIRYSYVPGRWPLSAYQTVFSRDPGSAEMPSAGRPFTPELVTDLVAAGVVIAPITLHAGVASLEAGEQPLPERFTVPEPTAALVNLARAAGRRVVAVGTTVTRALESAVEAGSAGGGPPFRAGGPFLAGEHSIAVASARADWKVRGRSGWTDLVLGAQHPARVVTGLITGWHDPEASHLALLEAVAGPALVRAAYAEAEREGYLGHEFGDSCLLLPPLSR